MKQVAGSGWKPVCALFAIFAIFVFVTFCICICISYILYLCLYLCWPVSVGVGGIDETGCWFRVEAAQPPVLLPLVVN